MKGLLSLLKSRKFWLGIAAIGTAFGVIPEDKVEVLVGAIVVIASVVISAIAVEDAATKKATPPE